MTEMKNILLADNDVMFLDPFVDSLEGEGYKAFVAETYTEAQNILTNNKIDLMFADVMMPLGTSVEEAEIMKVSKAGYETGLVLAKWTKKNYPDVIVVGFTVRMDKNIEDRFKQSGFHFKTKIELRKARNFIAYVNKLLNKENSFPSLKMFIVHGQDDAIKYELKDYIQNVMKLGEPVILHEQPSLGRTIIEKFEEIGNDLDLVFVLLTPDDLVYDPLAPNNIKRRARQNVIFELGYFLAKLERKKGRVLLLYKGDLELPSDIAGLVHIDVSKGIKAASEMIQRELADLL